MRFVLLTVLVGLALAQEDKPDFGWDVTTALDEYVHREDGQWTWDIIEKYEYGSVANSSLRFDVDVYIVNMTSQLWMADDADFSTSQLWWHKMGIAIPHNIRDTQNGALFITGGNNRNPEEIPPQFDLYNVIAAQVANDTGRIGGYILQVPNQPMVFRDDPEQRSRSEDDVIAYTWRWFIDMGGRETGTPEEVILRAPMTKAAKRGMDTIAALAEQEVGAELDQFIVMGASKRGWTTWSLAATDDRVKLCVPLVMSLLHFEETLQSHFRAFEGGWSFAFRPYYRENLTLEFDNPIATQEIYDSEDMYRYRTRLAGIPKLAVSATGDEFFLNQDYHHWWDDFSGKKHIQMCPNAEHVLFPHWWRIYQTVMGFWTNWMNDVDLPEVTWEREWDEDGSLGVVRLETSEEPINVRGLWAVTLPNNTRRDFRLAGGYPAEIQPILWRNEEVEHVSDTEFVYEKEEIDDEWLGFFIETQFESDEGYDMYLTSEVEIIPRTFPEEPCYAEGCYGYLT